RKINHPWIDLSELVNRSGLTKDAVFSEGKRCHLGPAPVIDIFESVPTIKIYKWLWWDSNHIAWGFLPRNGQIINTAEISTMNIAGITGIPLQLKRQSIGPPRS